MKEEFINYYKKELGVWNMVYRYMNNLALVTYVSLFFLMPIIFFTLFFLKTQVIYLIILFVLIILESVILNIHNKKIIEKTYQISKRDQGIIWGGPKLSQERSKKLELFVLKNIESKEQLEKLIIVLSKEAENRKFSGIFIRGLGIGLFLPLWNYFIKWIFENGISDVNTAFIIFIIITLFIIFIIYITSMVKLIVKDFFDRESTRITELKNMLEDISLKKLNFDKKILK
jgi:hypothetical protein